MFHMKGVMNNKGQAKLLAAVAVFAMVVCAFAIAMPAGDSDGAAYDGTSHYVLGSEWTVPGGVSGVSWESSSSTLTLTNYNGSMGFYYKGPLTIKLIGTNTITTTSGDGEAAIRATTSLTIQANNDEASLTIVQKNAAGWGISSSTIAIGDSSDSDRNTILNISDGGNRGTECSTMTIQNADVTINGSERGIRVQTGNLSITNSEIEAGVTGTGYVNGQGNDDIEGIKVGGNVTIDGTSKVTTQGMRIVNGTLSITEGGLLVVDGDYTQNPSADMPYVTTGLVIDNKDQTKLTATSGDVPATGAKGIYLINGAGTYGNISVTEDGKTIKDVVSTTAVNIGTIDVGEGVQSLTIILSDTASNLDVVSVLEDPKFDDVSEITIIGTGTISSNKTMDITGKSITFSDFTTVTINVANGDNSAAFNGVGGNFTVSQGSVVITGTVSGGTITVNGEVQFNGAASRTPTITASEGANVVLGQGFTVDSGATVTFSNVVLTSQGAVDNNGTIVLGDGLTINGLTVDGGKLQGTIPAKSRVTVQGVVTVSDDEELVNNGILSVNGILRLGSSASLENNGTIVLMSKDSEIPNEITGTGTVDTSAVASNIDISGDAESAYYEIYQTVTVVGPTTIVDGAGLVIAGTLIINEGVTLTIEDGGFLMVTGSYSKVINNGTIIVESDGGSVTITAKSFVNKKGLDLSYTTFENNGTVSVDYDLASTDPSLVEVVSIAYSNFVNNGTFTIAEDNKVNATTGSTFTNAAGATVYVGGSYAGSIANSGSVTVDSESSNNITVGQEAAGATVSIVTLKGTVTVSDASLKYSKTLANASAINSVAVSNGDADTIEGVVISSIVADVSNTDGTKSYYKRIVISGAADISDSTSDSDSGSIAISGIAYVNDSFSVTDVVIISGVAGELVVNGSMTAADGSKVTVSEVTVNGSLTAGSKELKSAVINAAMYCVTSATAQKTYYYTTFADAVAGASAVSVKKVVVTGEVSVPGDVTVPSGMTVEQEGTMTIGSDATVTVASGGKIDVGGQIVVNGTLYIEDKKTGTNRNPDVVSEVKSEGETDVRYTNLRSAIAAAGSTETTITLNGATVITSDLTIPSNVTVDTNGQSFTVRGAKLTVDGTLYLNGSTYSVVDRDSGNITLEGSVVVNGYMKSASYMLYDGKAYPAGAYYSIGLYSYITSLSNAPSVIGDADGQEVTVYGKNTADTVEFVGTATDDVSVMIDKSADITVSSMTVSYGTISAAAEAKLAGSFGTAAGAVTLTNMTVDSTMKVEDRTVASGDSEVQRLYITGGFSAADGTKACSADFTGDVYIATVSIDAGYTPANAAASNGKVTVTGNVYIIGADYSLTVEDSAFTVDGTMTVGNSGTFNADVDGDDSKVTVLGTLEVGGNTVSSTAGIAKIAYLVVGDESGTSAAVNGAVTVEKLAVYNGSALDADMQKAIEDATSTEFYVDDVLWMTAYNNGAAVWAINDASKNTATEFKPGNIVNGVFENWQYSGTDGLSDIDASKDVGDYSKLYASVDYKIYTIYVVAGNGIGTIAVNGIVMTNYWGNTYFMEDLVAGTYTITYTVKTGYEGESTMTVDGQVIDGKVTLSGTDVRSVTVNLSDVEPNYNAPVDSEDQGMGITDYLLIVLVVLIAIMAIVLVLRLMRS